MNLTDVRAGAAQRRKKKRRLGRGPASGCGKTSGRGMRGAWSRSGASIPARYEGGQMPLFRRLPKRGFSNARFKVEYVPVNVAKLSTFEAGSTIGPAELLRAGLVSQAATTIKVLGGGELKQALTVRAHAFSKTAAEKIAAAGGKAETI